MFKLFRLFSWFSTTTFLSRRSLIGCGVLSLFHMFWLRGLCFFQIWFCDFSLVDIPLLLLCAYPEIWMLCLRNDSCDKSTFFAWPMVCCFFFGTSKLCKFPARSNGKMVWAVLSPNLSLLPPAPLFDIYDCNVCRFLKLISWSILSGVFGVCSGLDLFEHAPMLIRSAKVYIILEFDFSENWESTDGVVAFSDSYLFVRFWLFLVNLYSSSPKLNCRLGLFLTVFPACSCS